MSAAVRVLASPDRREGERGPTVALLAGIVALAAVGAIVAGFFDTFWWPPDEGAYAYVATRILHGDVLNRDIQDIHAGYVNFANAAALRLFGENLMSLRYPLAAMAWLQAALAFWMLRHRGAGVAAIGAVAFTALSTVQFLNPTAHWYGLFLATITIFVLAEMPPGRRGRLELVGFLVVAALLFRQLSGIFLAMGTLTWLLLETPGRPGGMGARALAAVMVLGLLAYLALTLQPTNLILFGAGPLLLLVATLRTGTLTAAQAVALLARLALGGIAAALPLVAYHLANGSAAGWFDDVVLAALSQTDLEFIQRPVHLAMIAQAAATLAAAGNVGAMVNAVLWLSLLLLPAVVGLMLLRALRSGRPLHPLPVVAVFYALVSVHNQIPIYLWFSSGLSAVALLWLLPPPRRLIGTSAVALAAAVALYWQAGQPAARGLAGTLAGTRADQTLVEGFAPIGLRIDLNDANLYGELADLIAGVVPPAETILAVPNNPELYFIGQRRAAARFWNSAFGLRRQRDLDAVLTGFAQAPPRLVFHSPDDKYNMPLSDRLMDYVRAHYVPWGQIGSLLVYRLPATPSAE